MVDCLRRPVFYIHSAPVVNRAQLTGNYESIFKV
jgi:hypothetical protein